MVRELAIVVVDNGGGGCWREIWGDGESWKDGEIPWLPWWFLTGRYGIPMCIVRHFDKKGEGDVVTTFLASEK